MGASRLINCAELPTNLFSTNLMMALWSMGMWET
jgi:hypothetical protein